ncbi:hypothetical protein [Stenotrophomonas maltophilia]|uniref:hypothetical protein n=1 Tax=Stenotrophomonas maltophilia TaxID=40324 RepID=UPI0028946CB3|nr:hypothetical protein [Stenotrophomonas maltophilia]MDT3487916.1 hypothetical protein [Stenotrophomonas maltophilia]
MSATGAEKAKKAISDYLTANQSEISPEPFRSLMEVSSAMVGGLAGGSTGANIALTGDRFNRQLHLDEAMKLDALKQGKTADEQQRLNDAMCALVHCSAGEWAEGCLRRRSFLEQRGASQPIAILVRELGNLSHPCRLTQQGRLQIQ